MSKLLHRERPAKPIHKFRLADVLDWPLSAFEPGGSPPLDVFMSGPGTAGDVSGGGTGGASAGPVSGSGGKAEIGVDEDIRLRLSALEDVVQEIRSGRLQLGDNVSGIVEAPARGNQGNVDTRGDRDVRDAHDRYYALHGDRSRREEALAPVFRYGAAGDPDDADDLPDVVEQRNPPAELRDELGENPFGVYVRGNSVSGLGILDGDIAWCKRAHHAPLLATVAAIVAHEGGAKKLVVKQLRQSGASIGLWSAEDGKSPEATEWHEYAIRGVVIGHVRPEKVLRPRVVAPRARQTG